MAIYTAESRQQGRAPIPITSRRDDWWVEPLLFLLVFGAFVLYTTWRAFENAHFAWGPYLSPYYSPLLPLKYNVTLPWVGRREISPALYILIFPLAFRMSCYYYRKAYYRAVFGDPPGCAVAEPFPNKRMSYMGERAGIGIVNNFHRFAFYAAVAFIVILGWDTYVAFTAWGPGGSFRFGIGIGSIVFLINWLLLCGYTFGCHSWRHLIGGAVDCYSCSALNRTRFGLWQKASFLNARHAMFAWCSMISVGLTDLYVNLVDRGMLIDLHRIF